MFPDERGLWTNFSGTVEYGPKEEFSAPKGYHWVEDNWRLDEMGPWVDEKLDLGKHTHTHTKDFSRLIFSYFRSHSNIG